jgi:hypothetical protein
MADTGGNPNGSRDGDETTGWSKCPVFLAACCKNAGKGSGRGRRGSGLGPPTPIPPPFNLARRSACACLNCMNWLSDPSSMAAWCAVGRKGSGRWGGGGGGGGAPDEEGGVPEGGGGGGDMAPNDGGNSLAVAMVRL